MPLRSLALLVMLTPPSTVAPQPATDPFADTLDHVEVRATASAAEFVAYDRDGEAIGVIVVQSDVNETVRIDYDFDDGWASIAQGIDGSIAVDATLPADTIERRVASVASAVRAGQPGAAALSPAAKCALALLPAIGACHPKNPALIYTCPPAIVGTMCACEALVEDLFGVEIEQAICGQKGT